MKKIWMNWLLSQKFKVSHWLLVLPSGTPGMVYTHFWERRQLGPTKGPYCHQQKLSATEGRMGTHPPRHFTDSWQKPHAAAREETQARDPAARGSALERGSEHCSAPEGTQQTLLPTGCPRPAPAGGTEHSAREENEKSQNCFVPQIQAHRAFLTD